VRGALARGADNLSRARPVTKPRPPLLSQPRSPDPQRGLRSVSDLTAPGGRSRAGRDRPRARFTSTRRTANAVRAPSVRDREASLQHSEGVEISRRRQAHPNTGESTIHRCCMAG
jgi:hypothetical protein